MHFYAITLPFLASPLQFKFQFLRSSLQIFSAAIQSRAMPPLCKTLPCPGNAFPLQGPATQIPAWLFFSSASHHPAAAFLNRTIPRRSISFPLHCNPLPKPNLTRHFSASALQCFARAKPIFSLPQLCFAFRIFAKATPDRATPVHLLSTLCPRMASPHKASAAPFVAIHVNAMPLRHSSSPCLCATHPYATMPPHSASVLCRSTSTLRQSTPQRSKAFPQQSILCGSDHGRCRTMSS